MAQTHALTLCNKASPLAWSHNIVCKKINTRTKQTPKTTSKMVHFNTPPIEAMRSHSPPKQSTLIKSREHHVALNTKAKTVRHLLTHSQMATRNTNTSNPTQPKRIAFIYGALAPSNPYHWLLKVAISTGHARYLGSAKTAEKFSFAWGPFLLHRKEPSARAQHMQGELYELDAVALNLLDNVYGVTDELFLRRMIDVTPKNIRLDEELEATTPDRDDVVLRVEAYFADPLSARGLSTFMTWHPLVALLKNGAVEFLHREDELHWEGVLNERLERWIEAQQATDTKINQCDTIINKWNVT